MHTIIFCADKCLRFRVIRSAGSYVRTRIHLRVCYDPALMGAQVTDHQLYSRPLFLAVIRPCNRRMATAQK